MLRVVNFGVGKGGLSTVGYTVYSLTGSVLVARSTAGVVEIGTTTGIYSANVDVLDYDSITLWDTGDASPRYATEDYQHILTSIRDTVEPIARIYNSIKNQGEFFAALMDRMGILEKNEGLKKVGDAVDAIAKKKGLDVTEIEDAFNRSVKKITLTAIAPEVKIPEVKYPEIPDYSAQISEIRKILSDIQKTPKQDIKIPEYGDRFVKIESMLKGIEAMTKSIPTTQKDYSQNLSNIASSVDKSHKQVSGKIDANMASIKSKVDALNSIFALIHNVAAQIDVLQVQLGKLDVNDAELMKSKKMLIAEIKKINALVDEEAKKRNSERKDILMSLGHKR